MRVMFNFPRFNVIGYVVIVVVVVVVVIGPILLLPHSQRSTLLNIPLFQTRAKRYAKEIAASIRQFIISNEINKMHSRKSRYNP